MSEPITSTDARRSVYHLTQDLKAKRRVLGDLQEPEGREGRAEEIEVMHEVIKGLEGRIEDRRKELIAKEAARDGYKPPETPPQPLLDAIAALKADFDAAKGLD